MADTNWQTDTLANICDSIDYGLTESAKTLPVGPKFLRITDIVDGHIDWATVPYCEIAEEEIEKYKIHHGDIVIARTGATTGCSIYVKNPPNAVFASYLVRYKVKKEFDGQFVSYFLKSPDYWEYIRGVLGDKSAQPNASASTIAQVKINYPPLPEQRAIAGILGALDDKIELNRRMNRTLESMARAVFRRWFVEGEEVESWKSGKFSEISNIIRDSVNPGQYPDETFNHYSIPGYDEKRFPVSELGSQIKSNKFVVPNNCVLISKLNPETPRIWLPFKLENRSICSTEFLVNIPKGYFSPEYLFGLFYSQSFQDSFISMVTGTSGSHQRVKAEYVLDLDIELPPENLVAKYTEAVKPLLQKVQQNILESRTLASLRDALLPKLMRGEVRVKV